jgi:N-methylhydantoinase B/oxoprolinase/acetone carboxylase alpha subunit
MTNTNNRNTPKPEQIKTAEGIRSRMEAIENVIAEIRGLCGRMDDQKIPSLMLRFVDNAENKTKTFLRTYADELREKIEEFDIKRTIEMTPIDVGQRKSSSANIEEQSRPSSATTKQRKSS